MLRAGRMEEFVTEEEEPWYDQRDLEQGEAPFSSHDVTMPPSTVTAPRGEGISAGGRGWMVASIVKLFMSHFRFNAGVMALWEL